MTPHAQWFLLLGLALLLPHSTSAEDSNEFFEKQVLPILEAKCFKCHGPGKQEGELSLTSRAAVLKGGEGGAVVDLKQPAESRLLAAVEFDDEFFQMPPTGRMSQEHIDVLTAWVKAGVPFPKAIAEEIANRKVEDHGPPSVNDETRNHWSFKKVVRPAVPEVEHEEWSTNDIDRFILAKLEAKGLNPAPAADKSTLLRRAYYDLTGLPPTPEEVDAFLADESPDAYADVVDRLLASEGYGEKWGRHWLDIVHYAETNSFERDNPKPEVWRYRDYVVRSFNEDKPYDRFVREQLAGDELPDRTSETIIATGYYRLGLWDDESADPPTTRYDELDDWVATTGQAFLGLTLNCSRCHDHKLDPIAQRDYYRFLAFFRDVQSFQNGPDGMRNRFNEGNFRRDVTALLPEAGRERYQQEVARIDTGIAEKTKAMQAIVDDVRPKLPGGLKDDITFESNWLRIIRGRTKKEVTQPQRDRFEQLNRERDGLRRRRGTVGLRVLAVKAVPNPPQSHVMMRGNAHAPADLVVPGFPEILGGGEPKFEARKDSAGRRIVLANWIASGDNPLTARVMVNRLWQHHFGRGLVRSPNNFGLKGDAPTHPVLLDWLAAEFVEGGWTLKRMHRLLMLSSVYRMSTKHDEAAYEADPENDLYWRFDPRRLTAEEMRDSILAVNGRLHIKTGGPSVYPPIPRTILQGQSRPGSGWPVSPEPARYRRSIYIHVKRSLLHPLLEGFDFADTDNTCPVRFTTTQPTQALTMLNGEFTGEQATALAARLLKSHPEDTAAQVEHGLKLAVQRPVTKAEIERGVAFIESLKIEDDLDHPSALRYYGLLLLNLNEFVNLD